MAPIPPTHISAGYPPRCSPADGFRRGRSWDTAETVAGVHVRISTFNSRGPGRSARLPFTSPSNTTCSGKTGAGNCTHARCRAPAMSCRMSFRPFVSQRRSAFRSAVNLRQWANGTERPARNGGSQRWISTITRTSTATTRREWRIFSWKTGCSTSQTTFGPRSSFLNAFALACAKVVCTEENDVVYADRLQLNRVDWAMTHAFIDVVAPLIGVKDLEARYSISTEPDRAIRMHNTVSSIQRIPRFRRPRRRGARHRRSVRHTVHPGCRLDPAFPMFLHHRMMTHETHDAPRRHLLRDALPRPPVDGRRCPGSRSILCPRSEGRL